MQDLNIEELAFFRNLYGSALIRSDSPDQPESEKPQQKKGGQAFLTPRKDVL